VFERPRSGERAVPFARSRRFARGRIVDHLRELAPGARISLLDLHAAIAPVVRAPSALR